MITLSLWAYFPLLFLAGVGAGTLLSEFLRKVL